MGPAGAGKVCDKPQRANLEPTLIFLLLDDLLFRSDPASKAQQTLLFLR